MDANTFHVGRFGAYVRGMCVFAFSLTGPSFDPVELALCAAMINPDISSVSIDPEVLHYLSDVGEPTSRWASMAYDRLRAAAAASWPLEAELSLVNPILARREKLDL
ncbi:MAG: hypothetical protein NWE99_11105 [Candidatus Bathyarchaeota archaeon]|nr:hypothetical protein [Candidatus Bathyarchaeota archaeon]